MNLIKNAIIYRATLPELKVLERHIAEHPFEPVLETHVSSTGFIAHPTTKRVVTPFAGGCVIRLRNDSKPISMRAIRLETARLVEAKEQELGLAISAEDAGSIKEVVIGEAIKSTLPERTELDAFYHYESRTLIIPTTSKAMASLLVGHLVEACGAVETSTIHVSNVKGGLTRRLTDYFREGITDAFEGFKIGDSVVMRSKEGKASFDLENLEHAKDGITEALLRGLEAERLELCHADSVNFKLTKDFTLRTISFIAQHDEELDFDSSEEMWIHNAAVQTLMLVAVIDALCKLFGYEEPGEEATESNNQDPLYDQALNHVQRIAHVSCGELQRALMIGYNRAARLIERMEEEGLVSVPDVHGARTVNKLPETA